MSVLEKIKDYRVDGEDMYGRIITNIYCHTDKYVVYQSNGHLRFDGETTVYDSDFEVQSLLEQTLALTPSDKVKKNKIFVSLSMGLVACLEGNTEQAQKAIKRTLYRLIKKSQQTGQLFYLLGSSVVGLIFTLIALAVVLNLDSKPQNLELIFFCITSGALGGIFSVMLNLKSIDVDNDSGQLYLISSGASRILISVVGAFFTFVAIKGGLILQLFDKVESNYTLYAFTFLAGFSEKFVPNKLKKLEEN